MDSQPQLLTSCRCFSIMHSLQAVCETLKVSPVAAAAGLTVDNVMALLYFPLCDFLGRNDKDPEQQQQQQSAAPAKSAESELEPVAAEESSASRGESVSDLSAALAVAVCVVAAAEKAFPAYSVVASTLLTVLLATAFPRLLGPLGAAGTKLGTVFLYVFFATAGASGGGLGATLVGIGPSLLAYLGVLYCVHLSVLLGVGSRWRLGRRSLGLGFPRATLLTASNANIGGPATACALCVGHNWKSLVTPALVVGNFGYVVANFVALALFAGWTRA